MKNPGRAGYGWRVQKRAAQQPVTFNIFVPSVDAQWEYDLKMAKQSARQDGMRVKTFKRSIKAGGAEIDVVVLAIYEAPVEAKP